MKANQILDYYTQVFPNTSWADWFYALLGLFVHTLLKLKTVPLKQFRWRIFIEHFIPVWFVALIHIVILVGTLPQVLEHYNQLDSALIGYSASSIFRQLFKTKLSKLGLNEK